MPTLKQRAVAAKIAENHGNISKSMLQVGYSKNTAKKPQNLTESKGWQELMDEFLPDSLLAKVHKEGLSATKRTYKTATVSGESEILSEEPDYAVRHKYLDTGYKIRGRLKESDDTSKTLIVVISGQSANRFDAKLRE